MFLKIKYPITANNCRFNSGNITWQHVKKQPIVPASHAAYHLSSKAFRKPTIFRFTTGNTGASHKYFCAITILAAHHIKKTNLNFLK